MNHELYIQKITDERKKRDEERHKRIEERNKIKQLSLQELETKKFLQLKELQDTRRLQSKLNMSYMQIKSDERSQKIKEQNKRVKDLIEQFRQERLQQEEENKLIQEQKEEAIRVKLQEIKEKFKKLNTEEIREHQQKYQKFQQEHWQQQQQLKEQKKKEETFFMQQVESRLRSRSYQVQLEIMKEEDQKRKEHLERLKKQNKERFAYDSFVKQHFLPKVAQSVDVTHQTIVNIQKSDSKKLGKQYLRQLRKLPKRPRMQSYTAEQSSSTTIKKDYLTEMRALSKRKSPTKPFDIKLEAERLERESKQVSTKNKVKGDQLLMDSIKQKMLLLEL